MNAPRFAKLTSSFLAHHQAAAIEAPRAPNEESAKARARAIAAIEQAIAERGQKKRRVRWMIGSAAIAASVLAIIAAKSVLHHAAPVAVNEASSISVAIAHASGNVVITAENGSISTPDDGSTIGSGSRIVARDGGHAVLALSSGTRIAVDDGGDVGVVEEDAVQIFSLSSGTMRADVAKLLPGQRFIIRTADSEVEVHGTSFSVSVVEPAPPPAGASASCVSAATRVVVYEGVVSVRHAGIEARVPKGEIWPPDCATPATNPSVDSSASALPKPVVEPVFELPADDPASTPSAAHDGTAAPKSANEKSTKHPHTKSSSPLGDENDLFESGLTAERDGLVNGAISDFERYLSLYPNGPLAEHAAVRRMNLLRTTDRPRAVTAAKEYLVKYPNGFARSDAQAIMAQKP